MGMTTNISRLIQDWPSGARRDAVVRLALNVAAPLAVFCGLHAIGVDARPALALCFVPP
jgi:hypothetical protein